MKAFISGRASGCIALAVTAIASGCQSHLIADWVVDAGDDPHLDAGRDGLSDAISMASEGSSSADDASSSADHASSINADDDAKPSSHADGALSADGGACHAVAEAHPDEGALHYDQLCAATNYQTNPPSSGNHYGTWAAYKTYSATFPAGFWVHNLEHGAVVITYHCEDGCPAEVAAAQTLIDSLPLDPACDPAVKHRIIMLPDPNLTARFAASSWGFTLRADCFDLPAFTEFIATHYNHGREDVCGDGVDPLTGRGGMPICTP